jgi:peptide/nickel transport system ATP-binding protein
MRSIRAKEIAIVFQEPMTSLNPVYSIGEQIAEVIREHEGFGQRAALDKTIEMLKLVHISNADAGCTTIRTSSRAACASGS